MFCKLSSTEWRWCGVRKFQLLPANVSVSFYIYQKECCHDANARYWLHERERYCTKCYSQSRMGRCFLITPHNSILSLLSTCTHSLRGNRKVSGNLFAEMKYSMHNHNYRCWVRYSLHNVETRDLPIFALPSILFYCFDLVLNGSDNNWYQFIKRAHEGTKINFILSLWCTI